MITKEELKLQEEKYYEERHYNTKQLKAFLQGYMPEAPIIVTSLLRSEHSQVHAFIAFHNEDNNPIKDSAIYMKVSNGKLTLNASTIDSYVVEENLGQYYRAIMLGQITLHHKEVAEFLLGLSQIENIKLANMIELYTEEQSKLKKDRMEVIKSQLKDTISIGSLLKYDEEITFQIKDISNKGNVSVTVLGSEAKMKTFTMDDFLDIITEKMYKDELQKS